MTRDARPTVKEGSTAPRGRWIRPARSESTARAEPQAETEPTADKADFDTSARSRIGDLGKTIDGWGGVLLRETRRRVSSLAALERTLEDKIRKRWAESSEEVRQQRAELEKDLTAIRERSEEEMRQARTESEAAGRAEGHEEGYERGHSEGYKVGLQEGKREGHASGLNEGREEATREIRTGLQDALAALAEGAVLLKKDRLRLRQQASSELVELACEIAKKIVKRELESHPDIVLKNVEEAIELVFRRGKLVLQVHPDDAELIVAAVQSEPRWVEGFEDVEINPVRDVSRGGCRVVSGAGVVDMTIESQLQLVQASLEESLRRPEHESRGGQTP